MRTLLFTLLLFSLPIAVQAQLDDLLKNPDLSYVATFETEHDFRLFPKEQSAFLQLKKFSLPNGECKDFVNDNWLAKWVLDACKKERFDTYEDAGLTKWLRQSDLMDKLVQVDTVITFDPDTYTEQVQVVRNEVVADEILNFRTRQALFFDKKKGSFGTRLLAIAPIITTRTEKGEIKGKDPVAWLAIKDREPNANQTLQNPDITWAAMVIEEGKYLEIKQLDVKKNELKLSVAEQLYQVALSMKHPVDASFDEGCTKQLTKADIVGSYNDVDTVITFDPATYEEVFNTSRCISKPESVSKLMLVQDWFWDDRRKLLLNRLTAIAPMVTMQRDSDKTTYERPRYYVRCK